MQVVFAALTLIGLLLPGSVIEAGLGRDTGSLSWGPALFKALLVFHGIVGIAATRARSLTVAAPKSMLAIPWLPLIAMTGVAVVLRLVRLDTSLWLDEILAVVESILPPFKVIVSSFASQNQHMLYSVMAHLCTVIFGETAWAVRLPAVFFGVASLWALFFLGQRLFGNREALLSCALLTFSYHHIWFSQNARGYTGLLFFTLLSTWLWLEASERRDARWWLAYSIAGALGLWVHLTMAFVIISHGLISLLGLIKRRENDWWLSFAAMLLAGTISLQLYAVSLPEFLRTGLGEVSLPSEWTNPLWVVKESLRSLQMAFSGAVIVIGGALTFLVGFLGVHKKSPRAAWAFVLPALISGGVMVASGHNIWPRFFFFCMGGFILIAIHGALLLPSLIRIPQPMAQRLGVAIVCLLIAASASTVPRVYSYPKQDFSGARDFVEQRRKPSEQPVAFGLSSAPYAYYAPNWSRPQTAEAFDEMHRSKRVDWLIYTLPVHLKAWHPTAWSTIQQEYETVKVFPGTLGDGAVYVARRRT